MGEDRGEEAEAVGAAEDLLGGAFGVGHQAEDVTGTIGDAGDVTLRTVGIRGGRVAALQIAVGEEDLFVEEQIVERRVIGDVMTFAVGDGEMQDLAGQVFAGEAAGWAFHANRNGFATEMKAAVADEDAGEKSRFTKNLEAVADAEDGLALLGGLLDRLHDGREPGDGPAAEIIAIGEPPGQNNEIIAGQRGVLVPDVVGGNTEFGEGEDAVLVAVGAGEADDGSFQRGVDS